MGVITNIFKRGLKDILNKDRRKSFIDYLNIRKEGLHLDYNEILPYVEQVNDRIKTCKPCFDKGECLHCGCDAIGLMITPTSTCSEGKFKEMVSAKEWFKKRRDDKV